MDIAALTNVLIVGALAAIRFSMGLKVTIGDVVAAIDFRAARPITRAPART
jgi:hypothetical protein